ncbi:MAG: UPF0280 family protein [Desulfobacterota bacterium]|nr:UPF0280 family protein [Thermodesulfobacteriota bacterium]
MYERRTYRNLVTQNDLVRFEVVVKETDLLIRAKRDLFKKARDSVLAYRHQLETYIAQHPSFGTSLIPVGETDHCPEMIKEMLKASVRTGVGPMASVAGAIAQFVSRDLLPYSDEVIVENGGDIYLVSQKDRTIGLYAGSSPLSLRIGIMIEAGMTPLGICTSSGTVGHSLSFGKADAVCVLSKSGALADAAATAIGNVVKEKRDIEKGLEMGREIEGISGVLIVVGETLGLWGEIRLVRL